MCTANLSHFRLTHSILILLHLIVVVIFLVRILRLLDSDRVKAVLLVNVCVRVADKQELEIVFAGLW